jgi:SAM-dependent methyltransferase
MLPERERFRRLYDLWEAHQDGFNPLREARFEAMLDLVRAELPARFVALDLGSGPGALSARLLRRFPRARCVAVDYDPVVRRVGEGLFGSFGGRLRWFDARLGEPGWDRGLPFRRFDAALSTTALHWLTAPQLRRLYRDLGRLLRRGGVVLNGDRLAWSDDEPHLSRLAEKVRRLRASRAGRRFDWWASWNAWWKAAERDPALRPLFAERERRHSHHPSHGDEPLSAHVRALRRAGFSSVEVVWRDLENGVLFARR